MGDYLDDAEDAYWNSECKHGLLFCSCTICNGKDKKEKVYIDYHFFAKSDYECFLCDGSIYQRDKVYRLTDDKIVCETCGRDFERKPNGTM